jgi:hypothetical protein
MNWIWIGIGLFVVTESLYADVRIRRLRARRLVPTRLDRVWGSRWGTFVSVGTVVCGVGLIIVGVTT